MAFQASDKKAKLRGKAFVHWKNFWKENVSQFDVVIVYGISYMMKKLETKLQKELKSGSRVVSNYFIFSNWEPVQKEKHILLYVK